KVSAQCDMFMVHQHEKKCSQVRATQSEWRVILPGREWCVNDLEWSCSCLFYKSRRLPCQHIMKVAACHGFEALPAAAVHVRWSMKETEELYETLENGMHPLRQVINMVKSRPSHLKAPAPDVVSLTISSGARPNQRVVQYGVCKEVNKRTWSFYQMPRNMQELELFLNLSSKRLVDCLRLTFTSE
ncbi:hypothetical protein PHMEG_00033100, partial [Phytophthora megakarya]